MPEGFIPFDKDAVAQPELATLMGYESDGDHGYPNFRRILKEVATFAHGGLILFMIDSLQDYLKMEGALKTPPEFMRTTDEEKSRFEGMFQAMRGVRKEFVNNYLKKVVDEVVEEHKNDTDSSSDSDVEIMKGIQL